MPWDKNIPQQSNQVRGAIGDLVKMQGNFATLDPLVVSGLHALISGGSAVSGAVPMLSGTLLWHARRLFLTSGHVADVFAPAPTNGQILKWSSANSRFELGADGGGAGGGGAGESAKVGHLTMASGAAQSILIDAETLVTSLNTTRRNTGGFTLSSGEITVPVGSGYTEVRFHAAAAMSGTATTNAMLVIRKNTVSGMITDSANAPYVRVADGKRLAGGLFQYTTVTPRIPVSGGEVFGFYVRNSAASTISGGNAEEGTLTYFSVEAFSAVSGGAASEGEYIVHMTMASGQLQSIPDNTATLVTGLNTVRRNVGGFTAANGSITVPTGSGYTHVSLLAHLTYAGAGVTNVGYRQLQIRQNGDATGLLRDLNGNPYMAILNRQAPIATAGLSSNVQYNSPLLPVSGGDVFTIFAAQTQGSVLDVTGGTSQEGANSFFGLRAYKLVSGV